MMDSASVSLSQDPETKMSFMLTQLVRPLVDHPEHCVVNILRRDEAATFVVYVASADMAKFIGSNARTAHSLQVIVKAVGTKARRRFSLMFKERVLVHQSEPAPPEKERSAISPAQRVLC